MLSLRQPWLWCVLHLGKTIENRTRRAKYRGSFYLHASLHDDPDYDREVRAKVAALFTEAMAARIPARTLLLRGGICGRADVVDVILPTFYPDSPSQELKARTERHALATKYQFDVRWHFKREYGHVLTNIAEVPFVPCAGNPILFGPIAEDVIAKLCAHPPVAWDAL